MTVEHVVRVYVLRNKRWKVTLTTEITWDTYKEKHRILERFFENKESAVKYGERAYNAFHNSIAVYEEDMLNESES